LRRKGNDKTEYSSELPFQWFAKYTDTGPVDCIRANHTQKELHRVCKEITVIKFTL